MKQILIAPALGLIRTPWVPAIGVSIDLSIDYPIVFVQQFAGCGNRAPLGLEYRLACY